MAEERVCLGVDLFHWDDGSEDLQRPHAGIILFKQDIVALEAFTQYLRSIEDMSERIRSTGFAQFSRALIFADVPLNETLVHLPVVSDEPIYDEPGEQRRQLEAMRQRTDLSIEERNAYLQRLQISLA